MLYIITKFIRLEKEKTRIQRLKITLLRLAHARLWLNSQKHITSLPFTPALPTEWSLLTAFCEVHLAKALWLFPSLCIDSLLFIQYRRVTLIKSI